MASIAYPNKVLPTIKATSWGKEPSQRSEAQPSLLTKLREEMRLRGYSPKTVKFELCPCLRSLLPSPTPKRVDQWGYPEFFIAFDRRGKTFTIVR